MKKTVKKAVLLSAKAAASPKTWVGMFEPQKPKALVKEKSK